MADPTSELLAAAQRAKEISRNDVAEQLPQDELERGPQSHAAPILNGLLLLERGSFIDAAEAFEAASKAEPEQARYHHLRAVALHAIGRLEEARAACRRCLEMDPGMLDALRDYAILSYKLADFAAAAAAAKSAISEGEPDRTMLFLAGESLYHQGLLSAAVPFYQQAVDLDPDFAVGHRALGNVLRFLGECERAVQSFWRAVEVGSDRLSRYLFATTLPAVYESEDQARLYRQRLVDEVRKALCDGLRFDISREVIPPVFMLAYQGEDDRSIHELLAQLAVDGGAAREPEVRSRASSGRRKRVGIVSGLLHHHSVGLFWDGTIEHLPRDELEVCVLSLSNHDDTISRRIRNHADQFYQVGVDLPASRFAISEADCDILIYTDIGLDATSYSLAACRLAPVQCAWWGHPVTTGLKTVDYFISSDLMEVDHAQQHYTEQLIRLPSMGVYYRTIQFERRETRRRDFGLPDSGHIYACLQTLFKVHPRFDELLLRILRHDPLAQLVFPEGNIPEWTELLRKRFRRSLGSECHRVNFIPRLTYEDFLRIHEHIDVLLLPPQFGGGRTSYEALGLGIPVVTWPSEHLRGRITMGLYKAMGVEDCVARGPEDYVNIAVKLVTDPHHRMTVRRRIREQSGLLFEAREAVRDLANALLHSII